MLPRLLAICLVLAAPRADASATIEVRAKCAAGLAADPAHLRTLRDEVAQALAGAAAASGYTLDVSLAKLVVAASGRQLEVRAEVRAFLSDDKGRILWSSTARSTATGTPRDRRLLQRDALTSAARELGKLARANCCRRS